MGEHDPFLTLKLVVGYVVVAVWAILLLSTIIRPPDNPAIYIAAQGVMTLVAGGLFTARILSRRNGNGKDDPP